MKSTDKIKKRAMDVSIIIVNYNTCQMTQNCINSIFEHTNSIDFEVILVDNASKDQSKDVFENDTRIKYFYNTENLGFGGANNVGYKYTNGKYIFLLNSDTILYENSVLLFYQFMEKRSKQNDIGACGCQLVDKNHSLIHSYGFFPSIRQIFLDSLNIIKSILKRKKLSRESFNYNKFGFKYVDYITGADLFIKRDCIDILGYLFDYKFFMYYEETDLQFRMAQKNIKRSIISSTKIIHLEGRSTNSLNSQKKNYYKAYQMILPSLHYYLKKNFSVPNRFIYLLLFNFLVLPRILSKNMLCQERLKTIITSITGKRNGNIR